MIKAFIFDLDGTLVQTEILKAKSYARAAIDLSNGRLSEADVIAAFTEVVGLSRREVAQKLMKRFGLEETATSQMRDYGVDTPWQAFVQIRLKYYQEMLEDPKILHEYRCPYNLGLLDYARQQNFTTSLATMSHCEQASKVLNILCIRDKLDFVASRDDVENGKPDPEIYLLVADQLEVTPRQCVVIEDSPSGVKAALAAGMGCIAVTTDFTRKQIHESGLLAEKWIVDDLTRLESVAKEFVEKWKL
ncbi:HAD family phosphatase [candidate division KSB1 bacterium]|nr:HAD family phosphatase [candidate division KSB1 bacterium]NIV69138.1 HAD-IA family hydrolase [Phycisphaerae bacterium]NIS25706.1 HAD family phosphatase [candidate division KSB1 bacterium]NIT72569.1 HAD family phosphatase [candidate division KSB1 bacterium]NIU26389.1 HAD family phosphatase [candidate division KSB1 bacterium]